MSHPGSRLDSKNWTSAATEFVVCLTFRLSASTWLLVGRFHASKPSSTSGFGAVSKARRRAVSWFQVCKALSTLKG
jgi:hypothetical protein